MQARQSICIADPISLSKTPVARVSLPILALLSFLGYLLLALWLPLLPNYNLAPLADIRKLAPSTQEALAYASLLIMLFLGLGLAHRRDRAHPQ